MSAEACLKKAIASGVELYVQAGRLRGRGPRPEPELFATLREHEAEIVALLASRESAARTSVVDEAAEYHQRRIAAKEDALAFQGLGPDGKTPLADYQRLAAEGAKTAKAENFLLAELAKGRQNGNARKIEPNSTEDRQLAAGHECLPSKAANMPAPTPLPKEPSKPSKPLSSPPPWPEPKIVKTSPFGVDKVPSRYEPGWLALLAKCPPWASPWQWETAI
jgi:hypothetical protein